MLGFHASARCYPPKVPAEPEAAQSHDPLGLEGALEASFSTMMTATSTRDTTPHADDPLGLEAAFDDITCGAGAAGDKGESSDSSLPQDSDESDISDDPRPGLAPQPGDSEYEAEASHDDAPAGHAGDDQRPFQRMRRGSGFQREGQVIKWNGKLLGNITSWGGNISCVCKFHRSCRTPASRTWGTDAVLEDWPLLGVRSSGEPRVDKAAHQMQCAAMAARARQRR